MSVRVLRLRVPELRAQLQAVMSVGVQIRRDKHRNVGKPVRTCVRQAPTGATLGATLTVDKDTRSEVFGCRLGRRDSRFVKDSCSEFDLKLRPPAISPEVVFVLEMWKCLN
jgi:hypothetical protein